MRTISTIVAFATIMILAATTTANAQERTAKVSRWSAGPIVGLNLAHFWGSDFNNDNAHLRVGPHFGGFVTWSNDRHYGVTMELLYSGKGSRYRSNNFLLGDFKSVTRMDYFEMPILFRYFFIQEGMVRPHISAGPSLGFLLMANTESINPDGESRSIRDATNVFDLGMNVGGGVNIRIKKIWINPEIRYNLGVLNAIEDQAVRNGALTFAVGVGFPIGKID
ncbi:hypothetical protein BH09BAC1_BH09BAC1_16420 [soil metagenome]